MSELVRLSYESVAGLAAPIVNAHFDITNLYNVHGSEEDARQTAQHIEPDSIVFLEGSHMSHDPLPKTGIANFIARVAERRLELGKGHETYLKSKQIALDVLDDALAEVPDDDPEFNGHIFGIRRELVAKDCVVMVADADFNVIPKDQRDDEAPALFERICGHMGITEDILLDAGSAMKRHLESLVAYRQYVSMQHGREKMSIFQVAYKLKKIALADWVAPDLAMTEQHKRRAYTVWGTNHAASLTGEYFRRSLNVRQKVLDPTADTRDFIPSHDADVRVLARKRVLADAAAVAIAFSGYAFNPGIEGMELAGEVPGSDVEATFRSYTQLDRLVRTMRLRNLERDIAMQYAVPHQGTKDEYGAGAQALWNELELAGVEPRRHMYHPALGDLRPADGT